MKARTLGFYCAVEPMQQGEAVSHGGIIITTSERHDECLKGVVLFAGPKVTEVKEGDIVLYEKQSAHKSQCSPIDADMFGGTVGKYAVVIPCKGPLNIASHDDMEAERRTAKMERFKEIAKTRQLTKKEDEALRAHSIAVAKLDVKRKDSARTRRIFNPLHERGQRRGIIAVLDRA